MITEFVTDVVWILISFLTIAVISLVFLFPAIVLVVGILTGNWLMALAGLLLAFIFYN